MIEVVSWIVVHPEALHDRDRGQVEDGRPRHDHFEAADIEPESQRRVGFDPMARERALPGAAHHLVDVAVQVHVHRVGGARREGPAD